MTTIHDALPASNETPRRPRWPGTAVAVGSLAVAGIGLFTAIVSGADRYLASKAIPEYADFHG